MCLSIEDLCPILTLDLISCMHSCCVLVLSCHYNSKHTDKWVHMLPAYINMGYVRSLSWRVGPHIPCKLQNVVMMSWNLIFWLHTVNLALSSITSYPSTVGVIGLSSPCWLPTGSDMERGQLEYSTDGSRVPFTLARVTGLWPGGGVLLRLTLSMPRD